MLVMSPLMLVEPGYGQYLVLISWKYMSCAGEHLPELRTSHPREGLYLEGNYGQGKGCTIVSPWSTLMGYRKEKKKNIYLLR